MHRLHGLTVTVTTLVIVANADTPKDGVLPSEGIFTALARVVTPENVPE